MLCAACLWAQCFHPLGKIRMPKFEERVSSALKRSNQGYSESNPPFPTILALSEGGGGETSRNSLDTTYNVLLRDAGAKFFGFWHQSG